MSQTTRARASIEVLRTEALATLGNALILDAAAQGAHVATGSPLGRAATRAIEAARAQLQELFCLCEAKGIRVPKVCTRTASPEKLLAALETIEASTSPAPKPARKTLVAR